MEAMRKKRLGGIGGNESEGSWEGGNGEGRVEGRI